MLSHVALTQTAPHLGDGDGFVEARRRRVQQLAQLQVGQLIDDHAQAQPRHHALKRRPCTWSMLVMASKVHGSDDGGGQLTAWKFTKSE